MTKSKLLKGFEAGIDTTGSVAKNAAKVSVISFIVGGLLSIIADHIRNKQ